MNVTRQGKTEALSGVQPELGQDSPHFKLFDADNSRVKTRMLKGQVTFINVVPDLMTPTGTAQATKIAGLADQYPNVRFITVSVNDVNEQKGWKASHPQADGAEVLSDYEQSFGYALNLLIPDEGVLARSIVILDADAKVQYLQIVPEQTKEPDYLAAVNALQSVVAKS